MKTQSQRDADFLLGLRESFVTDTENTTVYDNDPEGGKTYNAGWELGELIRSSAGPILYTQVIAALGIKSIE